MNNSKELAEILFKALSGDMDAIRKLLYPEFSKRLIIRQIEGKYFINGKEVSDANLEAMLKERERKYGTQNALCIEREIIQRPDAPLPPKITDITEN
jgi:hypothetical protein